MPDFFLKSGALLALGGEHAERVALGFGGFESHRLPPEGRLSFYAPDFFLEDPAPWKTPRESCVIGRQELLEALERLPAAAPPALFWKAPSREDFQDSFESLQDALFDGVLKKGVPVVFEKALEKMSPELLSGMLRSVLASDRGRVYGFWDEGEGILGLTPEDLFVLDRDGGVRTMALAGTVPAQADKTVFLSDAKERAEHQWVIDGIRESLALFGEVRVGATGVVELPTLMHLKTVIELQPSRRAPFLDYVRALHPTAALGAFPREVGMFWLREEDAGVRRKRFGAPFGVLLEDGSGVCAVAIRNVQWDSSQLRIGSGCGVIAESRADREWKEVALKREAVKRSMGW